MTTFPHERSRWSRQLALYTLLLGLFLTIRGYRSREGDQAYRLPLLFHRQDAGLYAGDPFVAAFDAFNPHRGYLAALDAGSRAVGLSAALGLAFALTFLATVSGVDRLARSVWGDGVRGAGFVALGLVLLAQAGNVGTNHLFEPVLLDRLVAFGLGWWAIGSAVADPRRGVRFAAPAVAAASFVHPSVGLQLAFLLGASWVIWRILGGRGEVSGRELAFAVGGLALAVVPGVLFNLGRPSVLTDGLPADDLRRLSAELQSPQHMLPHLWRRPQWLAWFCYPILATHAAWPLARQGPAGRRLLALLGVNLLGLLFAWFGIERLENLRLTLFQPFRMATIARGVCLVFVAGHVARLATRGDRFGRVRAGVVAAGLLGDWSFVVATAFELAATLGERVSADRRVLRWMPATAVLGYGLVFLSRHDTESGQWPLLAACGVGLLPARWFSAIRSEPTPRRWAFRMACAWVVPAAALVANLAPDGPGGGVSAALVRRCRFAEVPLDDVERLAVWCREHTPADARFVGPPGPKTFRLWSRRSLAFNRAGSPYHAAGLADWSRRFRDHVGFSGTTVAFVSAYLRDRHALERGYDAMSDADKAALADRQGAGYVIGKAPEREQAGGPLVPVHVEGRYAVYRVDHEGRTAARPGAAGVRAR